MGTVFSSPGPRIRPSQSTSPNNLYNLPFELLLDIFSYLDYDTLSTRINLTCYKFHNIVTTPSSSPSSSNSKSILENLRFHTVPESYPFTVIERLKQWNGRKIWINPIFNQLVYYCTDDVNDVYIKPSSSSSSPRTPIKLIHSPQANENAIYPPLPSLSIKLGINATLLLHRGTRTPTVREVMEDIADWFVTDGEVEDWCLYEPAERFTVRVERWKWSWWYKWGGIVVVANKENEGEKDSEWSDGEWIGGEGWTRRVVEGVLTDNLQAEVEVRLKRVKVEWEETDVNVGKKTGAWFLND